MRNFFETVRFNKNDNIAFVDTAYEKPREFHEQNLGNGATMGHFFYSSARCLLLWWSMLYCQRTWSQDHDECGEVTESTQYTFPKSYWSLFSLTPFLGFNLCFVCH